MALGVVGGLCSLATACQSAAPPPTLEFWTLSLKPNYVAYVDGLREDFERAHPPWHVEWLDLPERLLFLKFLASLAASMPPDVVNMGTTDALRLADNGALQSTDALTTAAERARYFPQFFSAVHAHGHDYSVPWYVSVRVMMYNKKIFAAAGLDPSKPPRTWDEIEAAARAIRKTGSQSGVYGFLPTIRIMEDWQMDGLPILDESRTHAAFATPAHAAWLDWYARLYRDDVIPKETLSGGYPEAIRRYNEGRLGMLVTGPQFLLSIRNDSPSVYDVTGVAPLPRGKAGIVPASVMHFLIPVGTKHAAEAVQLALSLTSPASQLAFCKMVPLLPSTVETARDPYFTKGLGRYPLDDEAIRIAAAQLPDARDLNPDLPHQDVLNRMLQEAMESVVYGHRSGLEALQDCARRWDEVLAR